MYKLITNDKMTFFRTLHKETQFTDYLNVNDPNNYCRVNTYEYI